MSDLITWTVVLAYLAAALVFARSALRRWQADPKSTIDSEDRTDRGFVTLGALGVGAIWPVTLVFYALRDWVWKPADADRARWDQMAKDRDDWRHAARNASSQAERDTATTIADTLDDLLRRGGQP